MDQYQLKVLKTLQIPDLATRFSSLLALLKGADSEAYWTALGQLAQQTGIQPTNDSTMITQMVQKPVETWSALASPFQSVPQTQPQATVPDEQKIATYQQNIAELMRSYAPYENKVSQLYQLLGSSDQALVWSAVESLAQQYGVQTDRTLRTTVDNLSRVLIPAGWGPEYYPTAQAPIGPETYQAPQWLVTLSGLLSNPQVTDPPSLGYLSFLEQVETLISQNPEIQSVLESALSAQGVPGADTAEAIGNALWNSDYATKLNIVANLGGNPQPTEGWQQEPSQATGQPQAVMSTTYNPGATATLTTTPQDPTTTPTIPQDLTTAPTIPQDPTTTKVPTATEADQPLQTTAAVDWQSVLRDFISADPEDNFFQWVRLGRSFSENPENQAPFLQFLTANGMQVTDVADAVQQLYQSDATLKSTLLGALGETPVEPPAQADWTAPRGTTPVPNQPWAREPGYWQGGKWIPTAEYSPAVEFQETVNALMPWMSPMDQNKYAQYLSGAQPEIYGSQGGSGYGDLSSTKIQRLNPYEAYQYNTSNRIQSGRETILDPWGENQSALLDPDSPVRNWVDAVMREAGRYSPGGLNVPGARRTREQQSLYDDTLTSLLSEQGAGSYGVNNSHTDQSGNQVPLYDMWSNWLSSFLAPTQLQQPVSERAYTPSWRQNQYALGQYGSNRGWGYNNTRWS